MTNIRKLLFTTGQITLMLCAITLASISTVIGQEPIGPPKPVIVANAPNQPVPVTGIISGVVTLGNTPTVRIDPTSNSVVVAPRSTQLILNTGVYDVSQGGYPATAPIDVSSFSRVRVVAHNQSDSDGPFLIFVSVKLPNGYYFSLDGQSSVTLQPGQSFSRVYDVPGQIINVNVGGNGPNRNGAIAVFGQ